MEVKEENIKSKPMPSISSLKVGGTTDAGHKIIDILSSGEEYCIYEIDHSDMNKVLRVILDGFDDERERKIIARFNNVKQEFVKAKSLLYRAHNMNSMKSRVAHTLSTCLTSEDNSDIGLINNKKMFASLIQELEDEQNAYVACRLFYLTPICLTVFILLLFSLNLETTISNISNVLFFSSLGGALSLFIKINHINFSVILHKKYYLLLGIERVLLAFVTGGIAYTAMKAGIIFSSSNIEGNNWFLFFVLVVAGFSETLIPNLLDKNSFSKNNN